MIDAALISYATRGNSRLLELQRAGLDVEDFVDEYQTVWKYILRNKRDHDSTPSPDALQIRFPDLELSDIKQRDLPELVRQMKQRTKFRSFLHMLNNAADSATSMESVDDAMDKLQAEINALAYSGKRSHLVDLFDREIAKEMIKEIHDRRSGRRSGIKTGLNRLDTVTGGFLPQQSVTLIGRTGIGKASAVSEPVLTPGGWRAMGLLSVGDKVITQSSKATSVLAVHPQGEMEIYRVSMSDGSHTDVTLDHLWRVKKRGKWYTKTTKELSTELHLRYYLPMLVAPEYPDLEQPLDPYLLGALLGDGCLTSENEVGFSCSEEELWEYVQSACPPDAEFSRYSSGTAGQARWVKRQWGSNPIVQAIRELGLEGCDSHTKFIPDSYLWSSSHTRLEILRGLLDTDGHISKGTSGVEFGVKSRSLAEGVQHLVESLGGTAVMRTKEHEEYGTAYILWIKLDRAVNPFRLKRKAEVWSQGTELAPYRRIVSIELQRREEAQCITVEDDSHLYVTRRHIVTHNSWLNLLFVSRAVTAGHKVMLYPLEMTLEETAFRLYTIFSSNLLGQAKVLKNTDLTHGRVTKRKIVKFLHMMEDKFAGQLYVADVGSLSDPYTVARIEAEVEIHQPDMFWIDYLTLLKAPSSAAGDQHWQQIGDLSKGIKNCAMRRRVVGGASAQVNREALRANVFLPRPEHIGYGDSIGQDADKIISANRKGEYLYYALVKNRGGPEFGKTRTLFDVDRGIIEDSIEENVDLDGDEDE